MFSASLLLLSKLTSRRSAIPFLQVAVKRLLTSDAAADAKADFLLEIQTLQFVSAACQRVCRMLGCCNMDGDICIVMSLYKSSAAKLVQQSEGVAHSDGQAELYTLPFTIASST